MVKNKGIGTIICAFSLMVATTYAKQLKVLHLSFHRGCIKDFEYVAQQLGLELTSCFIPELTPGSFDPQGRGSALYSIGHDRAARIWQTHKDYFNEFDAVITSDIAPLARIFLQNNWEKPLIIWICNRFDYCDEASRDCLFPDQEYYELFREAKHKKNVQIIGYTPFEHYYTKQKHVDTGSKIIKPCAKPDNTVTESLIPEYIDKQTTFFIPPYHNDTIFCNLAEKCRNLGIPVYNGRYGGPGDLKDFKGIIHIPYAWSNLALFENMQNGVPYFIPSKKFILELKNQGDFFFNGMNETTIEFSEWYLPRHKDLFIYFDSWSDLVEKIAQTDFPAFKQKLQTFAQDHHDKMLKRWNYIFFEKFKTIIQQPL